MELTYSNKDLKKALLKSDLNFPEGTGIWLASKYSSNGKQPRINFTDSSFIFVEHCANKGYNIFLLGSYEKVLKKAVNNIKLKYPLLNIVGYHHGYNLNDEKIVELINSYKPDVLLVGMGSPKQELWIHYNKGKINTKAILSVGDLFTHWAGEKVRGPKLFRKLGFEWFFRAVSNPKNYFKRYFFGIPKFFYHLLLEKKKNH